MVLNTPNNLFDELPFRSVADSELQYVFSSPFQPGSKSSTFLLWEGYFISLALSAAGEAIKIFAANKFSEHLYLYCFKGIKGGIVKDFLAKSYQVAVTGPLIEELIFRLGLMRGISLVEECLKSNPYIQLASTLYGEGIQRDEAVIIYPSAFEEVICRTYMWIVTKLPSLICEQFEIPSSFLWAESESRKPIGLRIYLPIECDVVYHLYKKGVEWMDQKLGVPQNKVSAEKRVEQVFLMHLSALIFAAAHLSNPHPNKISAAFQFAWSYIGGVVYALLAEKYGSIAPSIVAHSINNMIAIYPNEVATTLVYIVASRIATYFISATQIDKALFNWCGKILR